MAPRAYAQLRVLQQAVEATKALDDAELADYIRAHAFTTVLGEIKFGSKGEWAQCGEVVFTLTKGQNSSPHADYSEAEICRITGLCRPFMLGIAGLALITFVCFPHWLWPYEDVLCLCGSDRAGFAAGQLFRAIPRNYLDRCRSMPELFLRAAIVRLPRR